MFWWRRYQSEKDCCSSVEAVVAKDTPVAFGEEIVTKSIPIDVSYCRANICKVTFFRGKVMLLRSGVHRR
jgi:hypothetical protein